MRRRVPRAVSLCMMAGMIAAGAQECRHGLLRQKYKRNLQKRRR